MYHKNKLAPGEVFGQLTILEHIGINNHGDLLYKCQCDCGNVCIRRAASLNMALRRNNVASCGCRQNKLSNIIEEECV